MKTKPQSFLPHSLRQAAGIIPKIGYVGILLTIARESSERLTTYNTSLFTPGFWWLWGFMRFRALHFISHGIIVSGFVEMMLGVIHWGEDNRDTWRNMIILTVGCLSAWVRSKPKLEFPSITKRGYEVELDAVPIFAISIAIFLNYFIYME